MSQVYAVAHQRPLRSRFHNRWKKVVDWDVQLAHAFGRDLVVLNDIFDATVELAIGGMPLIVDRRMERPNDLTDAGALDDLNDPPKLRGILLRRVVTRQFSYTACGSREIVQTRVDVHDIRSA